MQPLTFKDTPPMYPLVGLHVVVVHFQFESYKKPSDTGDEVRGALGSPTSTVNVDIINILLFKVLNTAFLKCVLSHSSNASKSNLLSFFSGTFSSNPEAGLLSPKLIKVTVLLGSLLLGSFLCMTSALI